MLVVGSDQATWTVIDMFSSDIVKIVISLFKTFVFGLFFFSSFCIFLSNYLPEKLLIFRDEWIVAIYISFFFSAVEVIYRSVHHFYSLWRGYQEEERGIKLFNALSVDDRAILFNMYENKKFEMQNYLDVVHIHSLVANGYLNSIGNTNVDYSEGKGRIIGTVSLSEYTVMLINQNEKMLKKQLYSDMKK